MRERKPQTEDKHVLRLAEDSPDQLKAGTSANTRSRNTGNSEPAAPRKASRWLRTAAALLGLTIILLAVFFGFAIHYWLPWPEWVRTFGAWAFPILTCGLWFLPLGHRLARRTAVLLFVSGLAFAYAIKTPPSQDWVALMEKSPHMERQGDRITIVNFRDAAHAPGTAPVIHWTRADFDLSTLDGADLILQPFGDLKGLAHVMLTFRFADGRHVIISMESRQAKGQSFDPLAGFFRRDPLYPILATERDLIWERLARTPPDPVQIYPLLADKAVLRQYFERVLAFVNAIHRQPIFYSTLTESCMTTFINLAPEAFIHVRWYDIRRWVPGYSLSLFQQLGLVDHSMPAETLALRRTLPDGLSAPQGFASDAAWSAYIRQSLDSPTPAPAP
ncbi:DUF4105 domain-containing protein [Xanthobacter autotrophicus]|jgi:hypothetical protein|uniref:DUF4105 domain-containing protein n=1 Tax=Xanthobacter autotrophicus TaxID=280 RepID=A0A6C1K8S9_XANAU|nr:DUF4105 domain-containing protein [Xanthobacter autotrophicus]